MFHELENINRRPAPFSCYTAAELWTDEYTSAQMLACHLNSDVELSSRNEAFIDRSVDWIASSFGVGKGVSISDFGCGPGLYATRLARTQAEVTGVDFSLRSIEYAQGVAQEEGLEIDYIHQNYLEFASEKRFHLVLMIMCDFCALSPQQRAHMLRTFHTLLSPSGAVLLDVYSLDAFAKRTEAFVCEKNLLNGFWSPKPYYGFLNTFKYEREKVVLDKYVIVEEDRTRCVYNWLQYFSLDALRQEFAEAGFEIETVWADVAGAPFESARDEFAVVARKR